MNIIREHGKFEGEPSYVPYLWARVLDGMADETVDDGDTSVSLITIQPEDIINYADLDGVDVVALWERSDGFVCSREMTNSQTENFRRECEQADDSDVAE